MITPQEAGVLYIAFMEVQKKSQETTKTALSQPGCDEKQTPVRLLILAISRRNSSCFLFCYLSFPEKGGTPTAWSLTVRFKGSHS